jgi:hypothetical protein
MFFWTAMSNLINSIILLTGLLIISCAGGQGTKIGENYATAVYYNDNIEYSNPERAQKRTERLLSRDTLYIYFESEFQSDTVDIKINNEQPRTLYLKTDNIGLSDMVHYGDIKKIDKIEIRKNNGRPLTINLADKRMNIWAVNFYTDTLRARRKNYAPMYE